MKVLLAILVVSTTSCAGWKVRFEFGYKDATGGFELTPPEKSYGKNPVPVADK